MAREAAVFLYLLVFRFFFLIFSICPQKKKTTFVASFGDNVLYTMKALEKSADDQIIVLKTSRCRVNFESGDNRIVLDFEPRRLFAWIQSIYHLATSRYIFIDNYFGFLAAVRFKPNVKCVQLWHAAGAIKQFGLKDPSNRNRSQKAIQRFKQVYERFDHVVVGSEKMAHIFRESFGVKNEQMLRTGIPRTDFFFDHEAMEQAADGLTKDFPVIQKKKVVLYAPTYRDDELHVSGLALDIDKMYQAFKDEYVLFLRLHPAVQVDLSNQYPDFVFDVSHYPDVNQWLVVTDLLITDYSSIPFEFSLLGRPMIFFAYDEEQYAESRGFWESYEKLAPGPVVKDTDELVEMIEADDFDFDRINDFALDWNEYSNGTSSQLLVHHLMYSHQKSMELE